MDKLYIIEGTNNTLIEKEITKITKNLKEYDLIKYDLETNTIDDIIEALDIIGRKRGCIIKGGEVDYDKVYQVILRDLSSGLIGKVTFD